MSALMVAGMAPNGAYAQRVLELAGRDEMLFDVRLEAQT